MLIPSMSAILRQDGGLYRELDIVDALAGALPEGYDVFHGMALHTVRDGKDCYGEVDVVVMAPSGALLLMEVKAGDVVLRDGEVYKLYGNREIDVGRQRRMQHASLLSRLQDAGLETGVATCLVLPDYHITEGHLVSLPRERIVDAARYPQLTSLVREWLGGTRGCTRMEALRQFLRNQFRVTPDLASAREQLLRTTRIVSDGLATWVPRIGAPSGVVRIQATAGSGKTQLALRLLEVAAEAGQSASYVCYNRSLADYIRARAPSRAEVVNFHELAVEHVRRKVGEPDFAAPRTLENAAARYVDDRASLPARLDLLVIDEGQDFDPGWIDSLCQLLRPDGKLYLMEDADQQLYHQASFEIADAVTVVSHDNYRSPRLICDVINALRLCHTPIASLGLFKGELPGFHVYASQAQLLAQIERAVVSLLSRGFALADIVVLSNCGKARSQLAGLSQIGPWSTRQFTGQYDRNGEPLWSDGLLLVESVYRFKGQSAPAVVFAELAFDALNAQEKKKLFVGLTRAQMAVEIVLTAAAEQTLLTAFEAGNSP